MGHWATFQEYLAWQMMTNNNKTVLKYIHTFKSPTSHHVLLPQLLCTVYQGSNFDRFWQSCIYRKAPIFYSLEVEGPLKVVAPAFDKLLA